MVSSSARSSWSGSPCTRRCELFLTQSVERTNGTAMVLGIRPPAVWEEATETATEEEGSRVAPHEQWEVVQAATTTSSKEGTQLHPCVLRAVRGQEPTAKN